MIVFDRELHCAPTKSKWPSVIIKMTMAVGLGGYLGAMLDWKKRFRVMMVCNMSASHV